MAILFILGMIMKMRIISALAVIMLPVLFCAAEAGVIHVPWDYEKIQQAIDSAVDGDFIVVSTGTYSENINFKGKNITLTSSKPTSSTVVDSTIIDAGQLGAAVTFSGSEETSCILTGFTIKNCALKPAIDGYGTRATLCANKIRDNIKRQSAIYNCRGMISNNVITANYADSGYFAALLASCDGVITNNLICDNTANAIAACNGIIANNTIVNNRGVGPGGMVNCYGIIANNIVWGNSIEMTGDEVMFISLPFNCCIENWPGELNVDGPDNIAVLPMLTADYRLSANSPCVDTGKMYFFCGNYLVDLDGNTRIKGASVDMGCFEYGGERDTDGDLLSDADEMTTYSTDLNLFDTDGDGLTDGLEILRGTNPKAPDVFGGISIPADFPLIQKGIFLAAPGEIIAISPGKYEENICFLGKNIKLTGSNPSNSSVVNKTIIEGHAGSTVFFTGAEGEDCVISGLTITSIKHSQFQGEIPGIVGNGCAASIKRNIIFDNDTYYVRGGGIYDCDGLIEGNYILKNSALSGGGLSGCDGIIQYNYICFNSITTTGGMGGGLYNCNGVVRNNLIFENGADMGGGLGKCGGKIYNNVIYGNGGYFLGGGIYSCLGKIENNIIYANKAYHEKLLADFGAEDYSMLEIFADDQIDEYSTIPAFCCIQDYNRGGEGNIASEPMFVNPSSFDFRLKDASPCIDAGTTDALSLDVCLPPGKGGDRNDIGAFGGAYNCGWGKFIKIETLANHILGKRSIPDEEIAEFDQNGDLKIDIADMIALTRSMW